MRRSIWRRPPNPRTRPLSYRNIGLFGVGYAAFPRVTAQRVTTPDHADFDITGDIDLRELIRFIDPSATEWNALISKGDTAAAGGSYAFFKRGSIDTTGFRLHWRTSGDVAVTQDSDTGLAVVGPRWYRVTMDVDDGAGNRVITFYRSDESPDTNPASVTWTTHSTHTVAGTTSILAGTAEVWLGDMLNQGDLVRGHIYYAEIRNGIAGTIVASPDFRDRDQITTPYTALTDGQSKLWTFNSPAYWVLPLQARLAGDVIVTPATIVVTAALPTPTILAAATVTPATVAVVAALPTPTILVEVFVTPATIAAVAALPTPAIQAAAVVTPAAVAAVAALPTPTIQAGAVVTPATIAATAALPTPVILAAAIVTPATIAATITLPTPAIQAGAVVIPATIAAVVALPTPTIVVDITVFPATIAAVAALPTPAIQAGAVVSPAVVTAVAALPTPAALGAALVAPATIAGVTALPTSAILAAAIVSPAIVQVFVALPTPTIVVPGVGLVTPATIAVLVALPTPLAVIGATTFWAKDPVAYTNNPAAFVKVGPDDDPPW